MAYLPFENGLSALICGNNWNNGVHCGPRTVNANNYPWMNAKMPEVEKIASALATEQKHIKKGNSEYVLYKDNRGFYMVCYENGSNCGSLKINATSIEQYKWQLARVFATNFAEIA